MDASASGDAHGRRLVMMGGDGDAAERCRTFVFKGENHTLGNALRAVILQNPAVEFAGYSIPHPSEDQMLLRIQTVEGVTAQEVLKKGFQDLKGICGVTKDKYQQAMTEFNSKQ